MVPGPALVAVALKLSTVRPRYGDRILFVFDGGHSPRPAHRSELLLDVRRSDFHWFTES